MRKKKKSEEGGFNVWRSYSDMMAGVLLLFVLIMCVTLFRHRKAIMRASRKEMTKLPYRSSILRKSLLSRMSWMKKTAS